MYQVSRSGCLCKHTGCTFSLAGWQAGRLAGQCLLASGGAVHGHQRDNSNVVAQPELARSQAKRLVIDALTAVLSGLKAQAVDERQELYADLGMDSLAFARLLVELEVRLNVHLVDEDLMTIELVTVADLIDLVERCSNPAGSP